ncbi:MAG: MFS transporter [Acidobacteria bacterium]|nr:MFS transporter [Acidobacteriota bacterium]MCW5971245.1 MFS transporter [Blastocatellales bacterium]
MSPDPPPLTESRRNPYAALRVRDFRLFLAGHLTSVLGVQMQTVAVGWQLYEQTSSALALGLVGLIQVIPMLGLALPSGHAADRYDRRKLLMYASLLASASAAGLLSATLLGAGPVWIYLCLFVSGVARAAQGPARSSLMPQLVPRPIFPNAVTWGVSGFELSSMAGPALGGALIALFRSPAAVYCVSTATSIFYISMLALLTHRSYRAEQSPTQSTQAPDGAKKSGVDFQALAAGFKYVWHTKLLLATMTLDLFAVLLGGAVALLPIYARDILQVGPTGLGWLQAAPSFGAVTMALLMAHLPPMRRAGRTLLWAVAGFGAATIIFGVSRSFPLSLLMLFLTGALDNISVVIRHTLVQTLTPDSMRGRVSAVNGMFINASNELGRFESGSVAALIGPVLSVVSGGVGTIIVVIASALKWPELRRFGRLDAARPPE